MSKALQKVKSEPKLKRLRHIKRPSNDETVLIHHPSSPLSFDDKKTTETTKNNNDNNNFFGHISTSTEGNREDME